MRKVKVSVRVEGEDLARLDALARRRGQSWSAVVRWCVRRGLAETLDPISRAAEVDVLAREVRI